MGYDNDGWMTRPDLAVRDADGNFQRVDKFGLYNEISIYEPRYLAEVVRTTPPVRTFFLDNYFTNVKNPAWMYPWLSFLPGWYDLQTSP